MTAKAMGRQWNKRLMVGQAETTMRAGVRGGILNVRMMMSR
jgi:hypothetical protein